RASIRGIDLILEQGMNVKVVTFPEGEDPDSFAKSHSDDELKEYLENSAQDFINFKVSILMEEAQNDPVKKAGLIRDIVMSISKIPDNIQREVYVQECARIMEISERVLFSELAQMLKKGNEEALKSTHKRESSFQVVKEDVKKEIKTDTLYVLEKEIIRILLLFGNEEVSFTNIIETENEHGKIVEEIEKYSSPVFKELYLNLQDDEIEFTNAIFQLVYYELINQIGQNEKIEISSLINHENKEIANEVTSILMDEEKYTLSEWERKNIFVTETVNILPKLVTDAILNLRRILIERKINEIMKEAQNENSAKVDLELISNYTGLKKRLFEKLNRVI
ncbi:MAG: DNA primase, partial [Polaribacter sp.]